MIKNLTLEEGRELLQKFLEGEPPGSYRFALLMEEEDGTYTYHPRENQPCYGELRTYHEDEYRPEDLEDPYPETGKAVSLAVGWRDPTEEWVLDALKSYPALADTFASATYHKNGLTFSDCNFMPSYLVWTLVMLRDISDLNASVTKDMDGIIHSALSTHGMVYCNDYIWNSFNVFPLVPEHTEGTLHEGTDYERVELHNLFEQRDTCIMETFPKLNKTNLDVFNAYLKGSNHDNPTKENPVGGGRP